MVHLGPFVLAIDGGTESMRIGLFDHEAYRFCADQYIATYSQMSDLMHVMTGTISQSCPTKSNRD